MNAETRRGIAVNTLFAVVCAATVAVEAYVVFADQTASFRIEGDRRYNIAEFSDRAKVSHAFLMRGDGMQSVSVQFSSDAATSETVEWTLWRGYADHPEDMTLAFDGVAPIELRPGRQWKTLVFPRDGSSHDRWYTIELRLAGARPAPLPQVAVVATHDNPDRGGVLFVNGIRRSGSLFMRAERRGRTLYRWFLADAAPNLPVPLRIPAVQWSIAIVFHWAFIAFAHTVLMGGIENSVSRNTP